MIFEMTIQFRTGLKIFQKDWNGIEPSLIKNQILFPMKDLLSGGLFQVAGCSWLKGFLQREVVH